MSNSLLNVGYLVTSVATSFHVAGVASGTWELDHPLFYVALGGAAVIIAGLIAEDETNE